jgi:hypothetical protein
LRARPSRRADDGSHCLCGRNAGPVRDRRGPRPLAPRSSVIARANGPPPLLPYGTAYLRCRAGPRQFPRWSVLASPSLRSAPTAVGGSERASVAAGRRRQTGQAEAGTGPEARARAGPCASGRDARACVGLFASGARRGAARSSTSRGTAYAASAPEQGERQGEGPRRRERSDNGNTAAVGRSNRHGGRTCVNVVRARTGDLGRRGRRPGSEPRKRGRHRPWKRRRGQRERRRARKRKRQRPGQGARGLAPVRG